MVQAGVIWNSRNGGIFDPKLGPDAPGQYESAAFYGNVQFGALMSAAGADPQTIAYVAGAASLRNNNAGAAGSPPISTGFLPLGGIALGVGVWPYGDTIQGAIAVQVGVQAYRAGCFR